MTEETISKVLTGETDIAKMSRDDFVELLKCLGRMYFARVMNCVDGTGKSDKEWTALSCIFSRVVEAITEKPSGNSAALREALKQVNELNDLWFDTFTLPDGATSIHDEIENVISAALAAPPRNCDIYLTEEAVDAATVTVRDCEACSRIDMEAPCVFCMVRWLLAPAQEKDGGAK